MSVTFSFADYQDTPCGVEFCGHAYRAHDRANHETGGEMCSQYPCVGFVELQLSNANAADLLGWLGISSPSEPIGSHPAADLAALCRRRLWDEARNHDQALPSTDEGGPGTGHCRAVFVGRDAGYLRRQTTRLLALAERAAASPRRGPSS